MDESQLSIKLRVIMKKISITRFRYIQNYFSGVICLAVIVVNYILK